MYLFNLDIEVTAHSSSSDPTLPSSTTTSPPPLGAPLLQCSPLELSSSAVYHKHQFRTHTQQCAYPVEQVSQVRLTHSIRQALEKQRS